MAYAAKISEEAFQIMFSPAFDNRTTNVSGSKEDLRENISRTTDTMPVDDTKDSESMMTIKCSDSHILNRVLTFDDATLIVNIGVFAFRTNMEVLEMYSQYMKINDDLKEITLPEDKVSPIAFVAIYEWMLSENPLLPRKGVIELYKAASYLGISQLLAQFWECVSNPYINEDRAYLMYLEALAFDVPVIRKTMLTRISRFFLPIVSCEEFLHIPVEDVITLLKSNLTAVNSELEIFYACVRYFNFNWEERQPQLLATMKYVRFDFLPTKFLLELLNQESESVIEEVSRMVDHPKLQAILRDLLDYYCLAAFPGPNTVSIEKSSDRKWIYDSKCSYHIRETPQKTNPVYILYMEFSAYMSFLCLTSPKHWESFEILNNIMDTSNTEKTTKCEIII